MPYDLCGTFHLALNNVLTDGINGNKYKNKVKINVYKNTIRNNCQYKSSKNEGDVAAGMTISVAPWSYAKHVDITYEDAYKMGTNSEAIPYKKAIYKNGEHGVAGVVDFYNNYINENYNNSPNPGSIAIRNMYKVDINKVYATRSEAKFGKLKDNTKVAQNNYTAGGGAAYDFFRNGTTRVYNTIFTNNSSMTKGGAVAINGERDIEFINEGSKATPTVVFKNNYGRTFGGAVFASDSKIIKFTNVDFKDNYLLSGNRWVTTMGLVDYYTNWFYGYKQGTLRKNYPEKSTDNFPPFDKQVETYTDVPFASATYNGQFWYVIDEDATYKCALKTGSTTEYEWTQLEDAWTYYDETRASAARGFVEPYMFGDKNKGVYVKRGSNESIDQLFWPQTVATYNVLTGAIGGELANMGKGGALALMSNTNTEVIFDNCDLIGNLSSYTGGALYANTEKGIIRIQGNAATRSEVSGNLAGRSGGFMMVENTRASLSYVNVTKNRAEQGGAIFTFTDPDKKYRATDSELYIYKTDITENGFLTDDDKSPYEEYLMPKESYSFSYFASGTSETLENKGAIIVDGHNYSDINNEARHTVHIKADKSDWKSIMKTTGEDKFNAGGAIYTYASQVKFDTGAYVAKNVNTLYSIAGSTILTRQTSNHDLNTKEEEITFEDNKGQYVFGHFSTFKAKFQFYGGKIINNNLDAKTTTDAKYNYIDTEIQYVGNKAFEVYTARPLSTYRKAEERSIVLGGNIMIKDNTQGGQIYNLGLEEGSQDRNYKFELSTASRLHKNAEIYLTPLEPNKLRYQVFGNSQATWEEEVAARRAAGDYDKWSNHGLWSNEWVEGLDDGAVVQNIFKNDLADDPLDGRVLYTATNYANNVTGYTPDFGQIYLEDPNNLIAMKFELYDLDAEGKHRYESQLETQFFSQGSKVQSPLSDTKETMKFSTDSSIRLIDIIGYSGSGNDQRFDVWNFDRYQVTKGDNTAKILDGNREINIPGDNDTYNVQTLFAINALTNHRHKVCGTPVGEPCNHPDGSTHDADEYIYGDDGTENLGKVGRKWAEDPADRVGGNLAIEVSTLSQFMYVRQHPEYMYVLTNDLVIDPMLWNRAVGGVVNDAANPIENLKLCLNGYNIYINDNRELATFFGENCYICNCQPKDVKIHYNDDATAGHKYYSASSVLNVKYPEGSSTKYTDLNIYGNKDGHIIVDELYMPSIKNNTFVNDLGTKDNDKFSMAYVDFKDTGLQSNVANNTGSKLSTSLLDLACDAYIASSSFTNLTQTLTTNLKGNKHELGQGIIRLSDNGKQVEQLFKNVVFDNNSVDKQNSGVVVSYHTNENSSLTIENVEFTNSTVGGRGALTLSQGGERYRGNATIRNSTFSNLNPAITGNTSGYTGGAIQTAENYGKIIIDNNYFEDCGVDESDITAIKAVNGGAIYIGACSTNAKAKDENTIEITNNKFIKNIANAGGAIYLQDTPDTYIEDNYFYMNKAVYGSAIYQDFKAIDNARQGDVYVTRATFSENGMSNSKGTYFAKLPTDDHTTNLIFEDLYARGNIGATSVLYTDYVEDSNYIMFKGKTVMTENAGGPVISINNSAATDNRGTIQFLDNTLIKDNSTNTNYAIYSSKMCKFNVQFAGIATVSNNINTAGYESNIYMNERIVTGIVPGEKFNGPESLLYFSADSDQKIMEWSADTITNFDKAGLHLEDHLKTDNQSTSNLYVIYKGSDNENIVFIGRKTDVIEIRGFLTSTISTIKKMLGKKNAKGVYMDNFSTPTQADFDAVIAANPAFRDYQFGGWIIKNSNGEYERLEYGKTRVDIEDTISLDAYWTTTTHSHRPCGCELGSTTCTHGMTDDETWVVAFRESVFSIIKDGNFLLSEDIKLSHALENTKLGYSICLNGHSLTRDYRYNLVSFTHIASDSGINIVNCSNSGGLQLAENIRTSAPLISVEKTDDGSVPEIIIKNVAFNNIKYSGSAEGSLIKAENAKLTLEKLKVERTSVLTKAIFDIKDSETTLIGDPNREDVYAFNIPENYYTGNRGLMAFDGGRATFKDVVMNNNVLVAGSGLVYASNLEEFNVEDSEFNGNKNESSNDGAVFYISSVKDIRFATVSMCENSTVNNGAVFNIRNAEVPSNIFLDNCQLIGNKAGKDGGAIYYYNTQADNRLILGIYNSFIADNEANGSNFGGGAIAFYSAESVGENTKNEIIITSDAERVIDYKGQNYSTKEYSGNKSVNANGGFIFAQDAYIRILNSASPALKINNNSAYTYGGALYLDRSDVEIVADAEKVIFENNALTNEYAAALGIDIYSAGTDHDAMTGATNHKDGITLKNVTANSAHADNKGAGYIYVGPYSDIRIDGTINIGDETGTAGKPMGLYFSKGRFEDLKSVTTRVDRLIMPDFDYSVNSKIYAYTEYSDDLVIEGYTKQATFSLDNIFKKDKAYTDDYNIYSSGLKTYRTILIGNSQGYVHIQMITISTVQD